MHSPQSSIGQKLEFKKVVLAGNPNVGKSLIFNHLSGLYAEVSNFPGTTVSITSAWYKNYNIFDTPGIYGVSSFNDEERVAKEIILQGDVILSVVNALNLERDLFLTLQLIDMGKKVSVILNMMDEVKKQNLKIDTKKLSDLLGVEVYETSALKGEGLDKIEEAIQKARIGKQDKLIHEKLKLVKDKITNQSEALLFLEGDREILKKYSDIKLPITDIREEIYIHRRNRVKEIVDAVESKDTPSGLFFSKLGRLALNPLTGIPILLLILTLVYFFVGDFVAQRLVDFTENTIGKGIVEYNLKKLVAHSINTDIEVTILDDDDNAIQNKTFSFPNGISNDTKTFQEFEQFISDKNVELNFIFHNVIAQFFFGEFGVITMTVTYLFFLLLPLVTSFYLTLAFLEDSGYLPRLAAMADRLFTKVGLNGKAIIPIILGFGCVTMATITTRMLGTEREKTIATAILQFVIPCSAQLAVITVLLSAAGPKAIVLYVAVMFIVLILTTTLLDKLVPGHSSPLILDLPLMSLPDPKNVLRKTYYRTLGFMKEATPLFFLGTAIIGLLNLTGLIIVWINFLEPLTTKWLQLPKESAVAFIMGMIRRDFGAAGLFHMNLSVYQTVVALVTITLFVPCIASFLVMIKERGIAKGLIIWAGTWFFAFTIGGLVSQILI
ncbi:MAG: ferrous iron transporter B [Ignavibacteria bacterium]|nr:ferrous iron transporter B [Ignavibacteria bacterium]